MRKLGTILAFLAVLIFAGPAMAEYEMSPWKDSTGILGKPARSWRLGDIDTLIVNTSLTATIARYHQLPLTSFMVELNGTGSTVGSDGTAPLTASTVPAMSTNDNVASLDWADGTVSPITVTFRVPGDYSSGGAFKFFATSSDDSTPHEVDFDVYVNADDTAADASATNQTPVAMANITSSGSEITLTPATDFAALAAGNWVTLRLWPWLDDDVADSTGDLEMKGCAFYYTATQ